jgi:hypothetical protein
MLHIVSSNLAAGEPNALLNTWLHAAIADTSLISNMQNITPEIGTSFIKIVCNLAKEGTVSKQKAKMALMDYGKIAMGEATTDILMAYSVTLSRLFNVPLQDVN